MKKKETLFDILLKVSELRMDIETAEKRILRLLDVGRIEQLPCDCNVKLAETTLQVYCPKCFKTHKIK